MATDTRDTRLATIVLIAIGALVVLPMAFMGVGMMGFGPMMGGMWGHGMWDGGTTPGWLPLVAVLMQLLFVAAVVGGGYLVYRAIAGGDDTDRALEELRLAYARGDLSDEEYEQRRDALERDE
ncbi:SHOCT domain-containing protein [Natrinema thermotolerans]|uniref:SHOCT domain-containing protein n=1 Tax=Natrinema thermotolerans TaxID=121872 RepID=A0AAF0PGT9_9EURY|nr:SHOCT domain-containing protein [Natrinema thermotolerans]QCC58946.1 SHOCT domain-containing protein [Natrinema thermotolerans]WMT10109.1 SHOCT domain-containing protein [Natrinema thermotolerans]